MTSITNVTGVSHMKNMEKMLENDEHMQSVIVVRSSCLNAAQQHHMVDKWLRNELTKILKIIVSHGQQQQNAAPQQLLELFYICERILT